MRQFVVKKLLWRILDDEDLIAAIDQLLAEDVSIIQFLEIMLPNDPILIRAELNHV